LAGIIRGNLLVMALGLVIKRVAIATADDAVASTMGSWFWDTLQ
jgi:hypothetical protein